MEYCSMKSVIFITTVIFTTQAAAEEIVYGQVGGSVVFQKKLELSNRARIFWNFRSASGEVKNVYSYNPMGMLAAGSWIKDRVSVLNAGLSLTINRLIPEDFSVFECEIHDKSKTEKTIYRLYKITVPPSTVLLATQTLSLTCDVEKSPAETSVVWTSPRGTDYTSEKTTVKNVSEQHHGVWKCKVGYQGKKAEATVSVAVVDFSTSLPQLIYTSRSFTSPLLLPCALHSCLESSHLSRFKPQNGQWSFTPFSVDPAQEGRGAPPPFLSLSKGSPLQWLDSQGSWVNQSALGEGLEYCNFSIVKHIGEEGGIYTCTLGFEGGVTLSRSVQVEVLRVESSHSNPVQEGLAVNITCTLGRPIPSDLEVKWTIPRYPSTILSNSLSSWILSHPGVRKKDEGTWLCELRKGSKVLTSAYTILRTVRAPVNVWLWVSISGAVVVLVLILILIVIFVRGRKQNMMFRRRRRKIKYCRCKHPQVKGFYKS
ncbi:CD4-1 molecule isoform X2 [Megalops cyprinoides]|nr:CD4-1 molecule isoform X2 [Megalops cyprinoides]